MSVLFDDNDLTVEIVGVFKLTRDEYTHKSLGARAYSSLSIRTEGSARFVSEDESFDLETGDIIYIPSNARYEQYTHGETIIAVHFINYSVSDSQNIVKLAAIQDGRILDIMNEMYTVWSEKRRGYRYLCSSLFYKLIYIALKEGKTDSHLASSDLENALSDALSYIHKNYKDPSISISDIARRIHISDTYFRRLFVDKYGTSPTRYIIALRLEYASQLLISGFYSVAEVAERSGFNDVKYFSRRFRQSYGVPPKNYAAVSLGRFADSTQRAVVYRRPDDTDEK
ncbi:MAG: helix-turn-helix transcriptional regulator [Clostridia bacterium]|nr:helix-turn-helix transcriptional regulator [Clostridia bacterium]